jgi:hypothetical protein
MLRQMIIGSIEHACMGAIIFDQKIEPEKIARSLSQILFQGVAHE